ncbi:MAG: ABC transporter substrate-binding protein [Anaerolineae bacterium]|nr:ABC transporter substrate-binding protein [Anaerolineae bacterium]
MRFSKKWFSALLSLFVVTSILLAGCSAGAAKSGSNAATYAVYAVNTEPLTNWDPAAEFSNGILVMNNMYEQLVRYDPVEKKIVPLLATEYTTSEDGLTWTFKLRKGVKFHDGTDFNAQAVKFSIERTIRLGAGASYIWAPVDTIEATDDYTVTFKLKYSAPLDLIASTGYAAFIYSPTSVGSDDKWFDEGRECGTGPYSLKSFKWGDEVVLQKFDGYWGGWPEKNISTVVIKKVSEPATRRQMVEKGEATITTELPYSDVDALKKDSNVVVEVDPSLQNLIGMFNTQKAPLDNPKVREALSYAFPYQSVIDYAMGGYAAQSFGVVPNGMWGYSKDVQQYTYDLDKAKQLLADAGYADGGIKLLLTYMSGDEAEKNTAELYKAELAKIGVDLEIRSMPWDSQWELAKSANAADRQDIFVMYWWPDLPSPYSFLFSTFHSEEEPMFNLSYYKNEQFDKLIDDANVTSANDRAKAESMFVEAQNVLMKDAATLAIYDKQVAWVTVKNFKGFSFNPVYPTVVFFYGTYFE